jgi:serine/threonine-protein kinase RsbT
MVVTRFRVIDSASPTPTAGGAGELVPHLEQNSYPASRRAPAVPIGRVDEIRLRINSDFDIIVARRKGREMAKLLGFGPTDSTLIATAISELARNIVTYACGGAIVLLPIEHADPEGILVMAFDQGPGIPDVVQALQDGYSTSGSLGLGLPGVKRLMDEFEITSDMRQGTTVTARKWLRCAS